MAIQDSVGSEQRPVVHVSVLHATHVQDLHVPGAEPVGRLAGFSHAADRAVTEPKLDDAGVLASESVPVRSRAQQVPGQRKRPGPAPRRNELTGPDFRTAEVLAKE